MSSLPGEQALKDGLSFEFSWTARHLIEVLEERAESIQLGGFAWESGVDFRLRFKNREEHHQVKRAFGTKDQWSLSALDSARVLADFKNRLSDSRSHCHFVSTLPAVSLGYLANRAAFIRDDYSTFESKLLSGDYQVWFLDLVKRWELPPEECWRRLQRVQSRHTDEREIQQSSLSLLRTIIVGDPEIAWTRLRDFCFTHVHQVVRAADLWSWLSEGGIERKTFIGDDRLLAKIEAQSKRYSDGVRQRLIQPPLERAVAHSVISYLANSRIGLDAVVLGSPGGGKSAVMLQIVDAFKARGWPVLAFRLDELPALLSPSALQRELDLPVPPAYAMAFVSGEKPGVLVIDQLDAVSHYSGRTGTLFDRVAELVREVRGYRFTNPIHLVIACRETDWNHDGRLRLLHPPSRNPSSDESGIFKVEPFTDDEINAILTNGGFDAASFSPKQREQLLRIPQYLAIMMETHPSPETIRRIVTPKQLFDAYWSKKERDVSNEFPAPANQWVEILKFITNQLSESALDLVAPQGGIHDDDAPLAIPKRQLQIFSPAVLSWMISSGALAESGHRVRFGHESFFDYCFARFFEEREETLLEYLLRGDQTLIQRGQVRQVLAYLRDENGALYLKTVNDLLGSNQVRPHLKLLIVAVACSVAEPTLAEWRLLERYLELAISEFDAGLFSTLPCQIFYAFSQSSALFRLALTTKSFERWLRAGGEEALGRLFRVLLRHQGEVQSEVWQLIAPLIGSSRYEKYIKGLCHHCRASQSRETFEWLVEEMRSAIRQDEKSDHRWDRFYSLADDLAKHRPDWLAEWIAALIRARLLLEESGGGSLLREHSVQSDAIASAAQSAPIEFVRHVLPSVVDVLEIWKETYWWPISRHTPEGDESVRFVSPDELILGALIDGLRTAIKEESPFAEEWVNRLRNSPSKNCQRIYSEVLCEDSPEFTSFAADFLSEGRMEEKQSVREIIRCHAHRFNASELSKVESEILCCFPRWENRSIEDHNPSRAGRYRWMGNRRGYRQMTLLQAMPQGRLSVAASARLSEWHRKFAPVDRRDDQGLPNHDAPDSDVMEKWSPDRFRAAIMRRNSRKTNAADWRHSFWNDEFSSLVKARIKEGPDPYIAYLAQCELPDDKPFIQVAVDGLMEGALPPHASLEAAWALHKFGTTWGYAVVSFLRRLSPDAFTGPVFELLMYYATEFPGPNLRGQHIDDGKRAGMLRNAAVNSPRGQAIEILRNLLWKDDSTLGRIRSKLPDMMREPNPALRSEVASLCYAIASREEDRSFAFELFETLTCENLPDIHVLATYWPYEFLRVGLREYWAEFRPIIEVMIDSQFSEVRSAGARLATIAAVTMESANELANQCVLSNDKGMRIACATVVSKNLGAPQARPWVSETLLKLAEDADDEVTRTTGSAFGRNRALDFGVVEGILAQFLKTKAFLLRPCDLIWSIEESPAVLPTTIFEVVQALLDRLEEPVNSEARMLSYHVDSATNTIKRLYHENRDNSLRSKALDMIDALCLAVGLNSDSLDQ